MSDRHRLTQTEVTGPAADRVVNEAWRRLERAADDPTNPMRMLTVCTVTPEGKPAGRLMLLRGADPAGNRLWCHSIRRCGKLADLRGNPSFAAVAYDPTDRVQLRLTGSVRIHELDATTVQHFEQVILARQAGQSPDAALPDPLWPPCVELLVDCAKRDSWKEFVVLELCVETIDWTQVCDRDVTHACVSVTNERSSSM